MTTIAAERLLSVHHWNDTLFSFRTTRDQGVYAEFERQQRYRLLAESIDWEQTGPELILMFKYHNLEADEIKPYSQKFGG